MFLGELRALKNIFFLTYQSQWHGDCMHEYFFFIKLTSHYISVCVHYTIYKTSFYNLRTVWICTIQKSLHSGHHLSQQKAQIQYPILPLILFRAVSFKIYLNRLTKHVILTFVQLFIQCSNSNLQFLKSGKKTEKTRQRM